MKYYKVLNGSRSCNGGSYEWSLPVKNDDGTWTPGEWTKEIHNGLIPCGRGYHLADETQLVYWLGKDIYEAEGGTTMMLSTDNGDPKWVTNKARLLRKVETWNDRTARLFAVWCADEAWDVAEKYSNRESTREELEGARYIAWEASWAAERFTAWYAARYAAWYTTREGTRDAQTKYLLEMLGE